MMFKRNFNGPLRPPVREPERQTPDEQDPPDSEPTREDPPSGGLPEGDPPVNPNEERQSDPRV